MSVILSRRPCLTCPQTSPLGISFTGPCFILPPPHKPLGGSVCSFHFGILVPGQGRAGEEQPSLCLPLMSPCVARALWPHSLYLDHHRIFHGNKSSLPWSNSPLRTHKDKQQFYSCALFVLNITNLPPCIYKLLLSPHGLHSLLGSPHTPQKISCQS